MKVHKVIKVIPVNDQSQTYLKSWQLKRTFIIYLQEHNTMWTF